MARGFNEDEKEFIRNSLMEQGRILFTKYGLQKTSISEITKMVGIAPGSFYKFYDSKEELYFVILELEEDRIRKQFTSLGISRDKQPKVTIKNAIKQIIYTAETNPMIKDLFFGGNMNEMIKRLPPQTLEKHLNNDSSFFTSVIKEWKKDGIVFSEKAEVIAGIFRSLFVMTLHQREIGVEIYDETMDVLIDLIVEGLVRKEG